MSLWLIFAKCVLQVEESYNDRVLIPFGIFHQVGQYLGVFRNTIDFGPESFLNMLVYIVVFF